MTSAAAANDVMRRQTASKLTEAGRPFPGRTRCPGQSLPAHLIDPALPRGLPADLFLVRFSGLS